MFFMKTGVIILLALLQNVACFGLTLHEGGDSIPLHLEVQKIYGNGNYCAFTSLAKYRNKFYCAFREGKSHVGEGDYGVIRIITSGNGKDWDLYQTIKDSLIDLRDPNLTVMPNGSLLLICGARMKDEKGAYITKTYYSIKKKKGFSELAPIVLPLDVDDHYCAWCWRLTWEGKYGYTIEYRHDGRTQRVELLRTEDGKSYERITGLDVPGLPSEGKILFPGKNKMVALIRTNKNGYVGKSTYPYTEWEWEELPFFIGGHDIAMFNKKYVVASRYLETSGNSTCVYYGDDDNWYKRRVFFPSGGDTGYCSILTVGDELWVSYYSAHESDKPSIYLCKVFF